MKKALYLADHLYNEGNSAIKSAIENVFIFSLSNTIMQVGRNRKRLLGLIPITLFTIYVHQVVQKGC